MDNNNLLPDPEPSPAQEEALDLLVKAVLDTYPMDPIPTGFTSRVMAEIRQPRLVFRLEFIDLALPAFFALFGAGILAAMLYFLYSLDQFSRLQAELQVKILFAQILALQQQTAVFWVAGTIVLAFFLLFGIVGAGIWVLQRPMLHSDI